MNGFRGWSAAILGVGFAFVQVQASQAVNRAELKKIAQDVTVLIQDFQGSGWGSGVIIRRDGQTYTVLTSRHVVENEVALNLKLPDGWVYTVNQQFILSLPDVDLALIQFSSSKSYRVVEIGSATQNLVGSTTFVAGFPASMTNLSKPIFYCNYGKISVNEDHSLGDGYALGYSNLVLPGMSGGPVLSQDGRLIGISGYISTKPDISQNSQLLEDKSLSIYGTSYAVPIDFFLNLVPQIRYSSIFSISSVSVNLKAKSSDYFMSAVKKINSGDFDGAINDFTQDIDNHPKHALAYNDRGFARRKLGDEQGAIKDYDQAIKVNPGNVDAYYRRGVARYNLKDRQGAIKDYNEALRLNPNYANAHYNSGIARHHLGDNRGAIRAFWQAANLYKSQGQTKDFQDAIDKIKLINGSIGS
jgi:S1-C subfamily serine protease